MTRSNRSIEYSKRKRSPAYHSWNSMMQRCYNQNHHNYKHYGARGIQVCERWRGNYKKFFEDMGPRPANMTLDRIDCNKHYGPDNCRWADIYTQNKNRRCCKDTEPLEDTFFEETGINI